MYRYFELFLAMGVAWSLSGILRFSLPQNRKSADAPYAVMVITVFLLSILDNLLRPHLLPMGVLHFIYPLTRVSYYLVGPALWAYVQVLLKKDFKFRYRTLLHLIPFLVWFTYVLIEPAALHPKIPFGESASLSTESTGSPFLSLSFLWDLSASLSRLIYSVVILITLRRHTCTLPDRVSDINSRNTISWLGYLLIFYTGLYLMNSIIQLIFHEGALPTQISAGISRSLPAVLCVFLFSIFSEDQPILTDIELPEDSMPSGEAVKGKKYEKSGMSDEECRSLYPELLRHIERSKAYVNPELTLNMLAEQMGETRHRLSELINRESGRKFFTFINMFRLEEFKEAVKTGRYPDYTILAIAMECGFSSSSAFYSLIRKELGTTPKALVKEIQGNSTAVE